MLSNYTGYFTVNHKGYIRGTYKLAIVKEYKYNNILTRILLHYYLVHKIPKNYLIKCENAERR